MTLPARDRLHNLANVSSILLFNALHFSPSHRPRTFPEMLVSYLFVHLAFYTVASGYHERAYPLVLAAYFTNHVADSRILVVAIAYPAAMLLATLGREGAVSRRVEAAASAALAALLAAGACFSAFEVARIGGLPVAPGLLLVGTLSCGAQAAVTAIDGWRRAHVD